MIRLILAFILLNVFLVTTAFSSMTDEPPPPKVNGDWLVDIRTICVVGGVVIGGTWWIGRWMQTVDDRFKIIESNATKREEMLVDIKRKLDSISPDTDEFRRKMLKTGI